MTKFQHLIRAAHEAGLEVDWTHKDGSLELVVYYIYSSDDVGWRAQKGRFVPTPSIEIFEEELGKQDIVQIVEAARLELLFVHGCPLESA